jgi:uncharacterized protein (UPF0332 family)
MAPELAQARLWLALAQEKLLVARDLLNLAHYDDVISKAYYVMFYAAKAALAAHGVDARRHSGAIALFGQEFVRSGRLDVHYLRLLTQAMQAREASDYDPTLRASERDARAALAHAESFLNKVVEILGLPN